MNIVESSIEDLRWMFSFIENDPVPSMRYILIYFLCYYVFIPISYDNYAIVLVIRRHYALQAIIKNAPFSNRRKTNSVLNNVELVERLWNLIG